MKKWRYLKTLKEEAQPMLIGAILLCALGAVLLINSQRVLTNLPISGEINTISRSFSEVIADPTLLHVQVTQKLVHAVTQNQLLAIRIPGIITAVLFAFCYYSIIRAWFTRRIAWVATILTVSSSWFLHITGVSTPNAAYILLVVPFLCGIYMRANRYTLVSSIGFLVSSTLLLYVPGMVWFIVPSIVWQRKQLIHSFKQLGIYGKIILSGFFVIGLAPLVAGVISDLGLARTLLALPSSFGSLLQIPSSLVDTFANLFWQRDYNPLLGIATIPFVNFATTLLFCLGLYNMYRKRSLDRVKLLLLAFVSGVLLASLNPEIIPSSILLPVVYIIAAAGFALLLQRWLVVFPKNPFAQRLGVSLLTAVVMMSAGLECTRYFIAWPHTDGYKQLEQQHKT